MNTNLSNEDVPLLFSWLFVMVNHGDFLLRLNFKSVFCFSPFCFDSTYFTDELESTRREKEKRRGRTSIDGERESVTI